MSTTNTSSRRGGFSKMSREQQASIASKGGKASHANGTAHKFDSCEATQAGRKGGTKLYQTRGPEYMRMIARKGAAKRAANLAAQRAATAGVSGGSL